MVTSCNFIFVLNFVLVLACFLGDNVLTGCYTRSVSSSSWIITSLDGQATISFCNAPLSCRSGYRKCIPHTTRYFPFVFCNMEPTRDTLEGGLETNISNTRKVTMFFYLSTRSEFLKLVSHEQNLVSSVRQSRTLFVSFLELRLKLRTEVRVPSYFEDVEGVSDISHIRYRSLANYYPIACYKCSHTLLSPTSRSFTGSYGIFLVASPVRRTDSCRMIRE